MKFKTTIVFIFSLLLASNISFGQSSEEAKKLLDEVSTKMSSYKNMYIGFSQSLINLEAGIKEGDEPPIRGEVNLAGEKYRLDYLGNQFIFDGKKLYVINNDEKEISVTDGDLDDEDGFIYPSKLLTFYKQGYYFEMGKLQTVKGRKLQFVTLYPIDTTVGFLFGTSIPIVPLPGIGAIIRIPNAESDKAISSSRFLIFEIRTPASGTIS